MYNLLLKATNDCDFGIQSSKQSVQLFKNKNKSATNLLADKDATMNSLENLSQQQDTLNSESSQNVLQVRPDQVHVIEEMQIIGKSLNKQISNLEWWQDVKSNINAGDLLKDLSIHKPELKELVAEFNFHSILTKKIPNFEKDLIEKIEEDSAKSRFKALGGTSGMVRSMKVHKVEPDFKSFNTILQVRFLCKAVRRSDY